MSRLGRIREAAERVTGVALRPLADVTRLEESELELRGKQRELQDLAYEVLDYTQGQPQDMKARERRNLAQRARVIHQNDPQYGGTVNLLNEFVLGRGIPKPTATDPDVQKEIDRFWDDRDNQRVLTSHGAQVRFNTDLTIQSNVFPLVYDDGDDALVKLGLLDHDTVEQAVRDDDARLRVLYYFTKSRSRTWDPQKHAYVVSKERDVLRYYEDFRNLQDAERDQEEGLRKEPLPDIPEGLVGRGRVLHVAINRTLEQAFGVPEIARTIRWLTAYNDLMRARVDMAKAAASIIMRRKLKGGSAAMQQLASQALLSSGVSAQAPPDPSLMAQAPKPGGILEENEWVDHQPFNLNSGGTGARDDAQMIRSQYSAATGWPASYLGDASHGNLGTATSLELRVIKMVEARQQVLEDVIGSLVQWQIQLAVEKGRLSRWRPMTPEERKREALKARAEHEADQAQQLIPSTNGNGNGNGATPVQQSGGSGGGGLASVGDEAPAEVFGVDLNDDEQPPEGMVARELEFSVSMPSPLRRSMGDLINAIGTIAKTFDPNNTNQELSKLLLGIALGEGLEVEDPGAAVERIFPEGYVDPAVAAALAQGAQQMQSPDQQIPGLAPGSFVPAPEGPDGQQHPNPDNPYGSPQAAQPPEDVMQQAALRGGEALSDKLLIQLHNRRGEKLPLPVQEAIVRRAAERIVGMNGGPSAPAAAVREARSEIEEDAILGPALADALAQVS